MHSYVQDNQDSSTPIYDASVSLIGVLDTLAYVVPSLLACVCNAGASLCCSILVPLLQLLQVVT